MRTVLTLFLKELTALRSFFALILALAVIGAAADLASGQPDQKPFDASEHNSETGAIAFFALLVGSGLVARESTEGTLQFLDSLPVSRSQIFLAKLLAGVAIIAFSPIADLAPDIGFGLLSRTSIDPPFRWDHVAAMFVCFIFASVYTLSISVALSFLRGNFILSVGTIALIFSWLRSKGVTWIDRFDPLLLTPRFVNGAVFYPVTQIITQTCTAVCACFLGIICFYQIGGRQRERFSPRVSQLLRIGSRIAAPAIWITFLVVVSRSSSKQGANGLASVDTDEAFRQSDTKRYEFLYRSSQENTAGPLIARADSVYDSVAKFLNVTADGDKIVVDLASPVMSHALGMTNWTRIRLPIEPGETVNDFRAVLGHETAHACMHRLGWPSFTSAYRFTRFFNEGMATRVEESCFESAEERDSRRKLAAAVAARGPIPFDLLCDNKKLAASRDPELVYPIGNIFAQALIRTCGPQSAGKVVSRFSELPAGNNLEGSDLWREIFERCGLSLDAVTAAYDADLTAAQNENSEFLKSIPRLSGTLSRNKGVITIKPLFTGQSPGFLICSIDRSQVHMEPLWLREGEDGLLRLPPGAASGPTVRYML